jgi:hypothetical protein
LLLLLQSAATVAGTPTFRSFASSVTSNANLIFTAGPAGVTDGDLLLFWVATNTTHTVNSAPAGWTQIGSTQDHGTDTSMSAFYKVASSEPSSYTFTSYFPGAEAYAALMVAYDGVDPVTPLDGVTAVQETSANTATAPTISITPASDGSMILFLLGCDPGVEPVAFTASAPSGAVARATRQNGLTAWVGLLEYLQETAGAETMTAATSADAYCETAVVLRANATGAAPVNTVAPDMTGTTTVGQQVACTSGTWTGVPTPTFAYQWQQDESGDLVYANISGATATTYNLVTADAFNNIRCAVTATNSEGSATAYSDENLVDPLFVGPLYQGSGTVAMIVCGEGVGEFDEGDDPEDPPPPVIPGTDFFTDHVPPLVFAFADASGSTLTLADHTAAVLVFTDHVATTDFDDGYGDGPYGAGNYGE